MNFKQLVMFFLMIVVFALYCFVSDLAFSDEVAQAANCAEMVEAGFWPSEVCE